MSTTVHRNKYIYKYKSKKFGGKDDELSFRYDGFQIPRFVFTKLKINCAKLV